MRPAPLGPSCATFWFLFHLLIYGVLNIPSFMETMEPSFGAFWAIISEKRGPFRYGSKMREKWVLPKPPRGCEKRVFGLIPVEQGSFLFCPKKWVLPKLLRGRKSLKRVFEEIISFCSSTSNGTNFVAF